MELSLPFDFALDAKSAAKGGTRHGRRIAHVTESARMAGFRVTDEGFFDPSFVWYSVNQCNSALWRGRAVDLLGDGARLRRFELLDTQSHSADRERDAGRCEAPMSQLIEQFVATDRASEDDMASPPLGMRALPAPARSERGGVNRGVRRSLELHWRLALAVAIGFAVLTVSYFLVEAFVLKAWPAYRAESIVNVQPTTAKALPDSGGLPRRSFNSDTYETYIQHQMMSVSRQDVLVSAVRKLNGFRRAGESDQAAAQRLARELDVTRTGSAYQFSISARAESAAMAAQIANAVTAACIESAMRDEQTEDAQRLQMWKEERDRIPSVLA